MVSIMEAVETLSSIVDMDVEDPILMPPEDAAVLDERKVSHRVVELMAAGDTSETIDLVKELFLVVLHYLKNFYRYEHQGEIDHHTVEGIKTIMVLVGEAAKKLDRYTALFIEKNPQSVTELKEYKDLQKFYQSRISRKVDEGQLGRWILGLSGFGGALEKEEKAPSEVSEMKARYVFMDLETVKKDLEYELFYLRKDDGSRFFNPRLIRNMKLVSDFGAYFGDVKQEDPLIDLLYWKDRCAQASAIDLLNFLGTRVQKFFFETARFRKGELAGILNSAMMALLLSSHQKHLLKNQPAKSCLDYYDDFQEFLWEALQSREYQKMIAYPPASSNTVAKCLIDTLHQLCKGVFLSLNGDKELLLAIRELLDREDQNERKINESGSYVDFLESDYASLSDKMKMHSNGPLMLLLSDLEKGECMLFHPMKNHHLPALICSLYCKNYSVLNVHMPTPTVQEYIQKAHIDELFHGFVRAYQQDAAEKKHLLINLQDRTSWRESARCQLLEAFPKASELQKELVVMTLPADTDFYYQAPPYQEDKEASVFKAHFIEHLSDEAAGFYFPERVKKALFPDFMTHLLDAVHRVFFGNRKTLTQSERCDFISIVYNLIMLKTIEVIHPSSYSLVCKDGIDISGSLNAMLILFLKLVNHQPLKQNDRDCIQYLLYVPPLMVRERLMIQERFDRLVSLVRLLEGLQAHYGGADFALMFHEACAPLYQTSILQSQVISIK